MAYRHPAVGHILVDEVGHLLQTVDAAAHEIHLSVAAHLEVDGVCDDLVAKGGQLSLYGIAVGRRRAYDAHVACPHERELQCARNGSRRHREGVDVGLERAQLLLCGHSKLLFLVDDEQPQVVPFHLFAYQLVGADEYVYLARLKVGEDLPRLFGRARAGEVVHAHGEVVQSLGEGLVVLVGEHSGRHEHRHLLGVAGCLECRSYGHFGLAEAHVAADEPVHGMCALHVGLDVLRGLELVGRVLIEEACFQLVLHERVVAVGETLHIPPFGIEPDEVAGDVLDALLGPLLHAVPCAGAEHAQPWRLPSLA